MSQELSVIRIPPYHYIHVLDQTTNVTRLEVGPATFVRKDNEMVVSGEKYLILFNSGGKRVLGCRRDHKQYFRIRSPHNSTVKKESMAPILDPDPGPTGFESSKRDEF